MIVSRRSNFINNSCNNEQLSLKVAPFKYNLGCLLSFPMYSASDEKNTRDPLNADTTIAQST